MIKFKYLLLSIAIICLLIFVLSISGVLQMFTAKQNNSSFELSGPGDKFELLNFAENETVGSVKNHINNNASQEILGLYLPNYDESGKEVSVVQSKYSALFENKIYKIKEPIIQFKNLTEKNVSSGMTDVIITADDGIINMETSLGTLTGHVVIQLDKETKVKTRELAYLPRLRRIYTDGDVEIASDKMVIKGHEFEINLGSLKVSIKDNVRLELANINSKNVLSGTKELPGGKSYKNNNFAGMFDDLEPEEGLPISFVRSKGELIFDLATNVVTFFDDVEAFIGELTIFADELKVLLETENRKVKEIIANGNVLAMDGVNIAKGSTLIWDSAAGVTTIQDKVAAEFLNDTAFVTSSKIRLYQGTGWAEAPAAGKLTTMSHLNLLDNPADIFDDELEMESAFDSIFSNKTKEEDKQGYGYFYHQYKMMKEKFKTNDKNDIKNVNVTWQGRMLFKNDEHKAKFNDNVEIIKPGSKMDCDELSILFNDKNEIVAFTATDKVKIVEEEDNRKTEIEADMLTWEVDGKPLELTGEPFAKINIDNKELTSAKILVFNEGDKITADEKGNITFYPNNPPGAENEYTGRISLEWQGNMVFTRSDKKASFYENVQVLKDGINIRCDLFDVFFDKTENLKRIVAMENVYVSSDIFPNTEAFGTMLTWNIDENVVVLTGDPLAELRKDGSRTLSKRIFFDLATKHVTWEGGSQWQLNPESN